PSLICALFPYTTLFRSHLGADRVDLETERAADILFHLRVYTGVCPHRPAELAGGNFSLRCIQSCGRPVQLRHPAGYLEPERDRRSEEHTSELQSLTNLV